MSKRNTSNRNGRMLYQVGERTLAPGFPDVESALRDPDGLLAIGGDLEPDRLLDAYRRGIFPWYGDGQPILWWSPDPRCVLYPDRIHVSGSLQKTLRRQTFLVTFNQAFEQVIKECAAPRRGHPGTWISDEIIAAYAELFRRGHIVSVECWHGAELAGGLYGVVIGKVFFGESMFSRMSDASKVALVHLGALLASRQFALIDCQVHSPHLASLGACLMPRRQFTAMLGQYCRDDTPVHDWPQASTLA